MGAVFFFTIGVEPAFTSAEMLRILPVSHRGAALHVLAERCFTLQSWCGGIALAQLLIEWLYSGRPLRRWVLYLVLGLWSWGLVGGFWLQPQLRRLHLDLYGIRSTVPQRQHAAQAVKIWHGIILTGNVLANLSLLAYVLQITSAATAPRFVSTNKFRG